MVMSSKEEVIVAESLRRIQEDVERDIESGKTSVLAMSPSILNPSDDLLKEVIMPSAAQIITFLRVREATKWN